MSDGRFSRFSTDPKFLSVARKDKKVEVDKRFRAMFKKKGKFIASESSVDARGRPKILTKSTKDNYQKFYHIKDTNYSSVSENTSDAGGEKKTLKTNIGYNPKSKLLDLNVDYARGEANLYSSSSSDEESSSEDSSDDDSDEQMDGNDAQQWDKWGELDHEAEYTEEATSRIAVCNMDWDRVDAQDIYIAMSSFCPTGSAGVKSVRIYKSEFGKTRMAEEERLGPEELRGTAEPENDKSFSDEEPLRDEDVKEMDNKAMERVRKYQISRLKYYYAVVDFDSVGSATTVYKACDGVEYELSATRFDLRFIPSETEFDEEPTSSCESTPNPERYRPKMFSTTALTLGKVELTWDEVNPDRARAMKRAFSEAELEEGRAAAAMEYIAMSSDDEIGDKEECEAENGTDENEADAPEDAINKYKALLAGIVKRKCSSMEEEEEDDLEISWGPRDALKRGLDQRDAKKMTPWEQYLHKKNEMRKLKRQERKMKNQPANADKSFSNYDSPEAANLKDSICNDEFGEMGRRAKDKGKRQQKKKGRDEVGENTTVSGNSEANDLSLLIMDEEEDRKHFDYKDIVSNCKRDKNRRRKIIEEEQNTSDHFKVDLNDQRFSAVFYNPEFNVDPSNPHFKKTKSMQDIVEEKQRRAVKGLPQERKGERKKRLKLEIDKDSSTLSTSSKSLELLVKAVKNKTVDSKKCA